MAEPPGPPHDGYILEPAPENMRNYRAFLRSCINKDELKDALVPQYYINDLGVWGCDCPSVLVLAIVYNG